MKYQVQIKEILVKTIEVDEASKAKAIDKAVELYCNEEVVLDYDCIIDTKFKIVNGEVLNG